MIEFKFENFEKELLKDYYGIDLEVELINQQIDYVKKIRDNKQLDLTDEHIYHYIRFQYIQQQSNDIIYIRIPYTSTQLKELSASLPGCAEVCLALTLNYSMEKL